MGNVTLLIKDRGAIVTLARPEAMNALSHSTKVALLAILEQVACDRSARAVIFMGGGRSFCVGQDLRELSADLIADSNAAWDTVRDHYSAIARLLATMSKPTIAVINGVAAGAGVGFALACDYRLASTEASINLAFASIGLAADSGTTWTLPRLVGTARAKSLLMHPITIDASAALAMGLLGEIVAPESLMPSAWGLAEEFANGPTIAYAAIRESLLCTAAHSLDESLWMEEQLCA